MEAVAFAIAGPAFAVSALLLRSSTPLPPRLFDATAAVLACWGLAPLLARSRGPVWAALLRGAGVMLAAGLVSLTLVAPYDRSAGPALVLIAGGVILQAEARSRGRIWASALGLAVLAGGGALAFVLADLFPEAGRLRLALVVAALLAAFGLAARFGLRRRGYESLAPAPAGALVVGAVAGAYIAFRSLVAAHVSNLPLYEWSLGASLAMLVLARLRRRARMNEAPEAWRGEARRHAQDVAPLYDARMGPVAAAVARYLDTGTGFDAYRIAMSVPTAHAAYRDAVQAMRPVAPTRGRAGNVAARNARVATHDALLNLLEARGTPDGTVPARRA